MLDMGFMEDIEVILSALPTERQTGLFSATLPKRVPTWPRATSTSPISIRVEPEHITVAQIAQAYYEVVPRAKLEALTRILDLEDPASAHHLLPHQAGSGRGDAGAAGARLPLRGAARRPLAADARPRHGALPRRHGRR